MPPPKRAKIKIKLSLIYCLYVSTYLQLSNKISDYLSTSYLGIISLQSYLVSNYIQVGTFSKRSYFQPA